MLSKKYRLPGYLIPQVIKEGRTIVTPLFVLKFLPLSTLQQFNNETMKQWSNSLFAFVFSKKLDKRAVVRNRAKRRLSEAVRLLMPQIKPGWAIIFLAKKEILDKNYQEIFGQVVKIFREIGVIRER